MWFRYRNHRAVLEGRPLSGPPVPLDQSGVWVDYVPYLSVCLVRRMAAGPFTTKTYRVAFRWLHATSLDQRVQWTWAPWQRPFSFRVKGQLRHPPHTECTCDE